MKNRFKSALLAAFGLWIILLSAAGCQDTPTSEPTQPPEPDDATMAEPRRSLTPKSVSAVTGTVTYQERIALSPGDTLEVELRDVSRQDTSSTLIARQAVPSPGQVPVSFRIEYDPGDIEPGNTYAVEARITYRDGTLAFISDTAYEVITMGRPNRVDMVLAAVNPPPEPGSVSTAFPDVAWVEVATPIRGVEVEKYEEGYLLKATFLLPGGADCSRHSSVIAERVGVNIAATVNNLEQRARDGSPACASGPREGEVEIPIEGPFTPGETYRVRVNDRLTNLFTPPREGFPDSDVVPSPIEEYELLILEIFPPQYTVRVVSALPMGSSCSQFNGYDIEHSAPGRIDVMITHHEVVAGNVPCTEDYPTVESSIPLGADFEPGRDYTVYLNDAVLTFRAQ